MRSALCTSGFYIWAICLGLAMIPMVILPRPMFRWFVQLWSTGNAFLLRHVAGITVEVRGREYLPSTPVIIASKHQSEWESNVFLHLVDDPVYIIKRELSFIPAYGQYARKMGMIFIDRRGHASTVRKLIRDATRAISAGRSIVIFPEGTRVAPGKKLPYRSGVAALYSALDVQVVPVVLNSGLYWPKKSFRKYPGTIVLQFLPPIPAGLERHVFLRRLEEVMERASSSLLAETLGEEPPASTLEQNRASFGG